MIRITQNDSGPDPEYVLKAAKQYKPMCCSNCLQHKPLYTNDPECLWLCKECFIEDFGVEPIDRNDTTE